MGEPQQKPHIQWLIKNKNGKISGPYSTEAVLKLISQNIFTGNEEVSLYPGGKWMEISREPQFYDQLLSALEGLVKKNPDEEKMNAETVIQVPVTQKRKTDSEDTQSKESKNESTRTEIASSLPKKGADFSADDLESSSRKRKNTEAGDILALLGTRNPNVEIASKSRRKSLPPLKMGKGGGSGPIIDLEDLTKVKKQNIKKSAKLPMIFVAIALGLAVFAAYFLQDSTGIQEKIRLLAPRQNGTPLSSEDVKEGFSPAVSNFIADRFENYLNAQNQLVRLVEGSPQNTEIRGFLCLVYRELWPFAFQDSEDIRTLSFMAQSTRALNPIGLHGNICEAVKMSATGRYAEAKSVIESALNDPEYGKDPILHQLYGEIIYGEKDYKVASAWIDKAQKLWPDWIKPIMVQGQIQVALHKFPEAAALFRSILNRVPSHMGAKVELALIEMKEFKQVDTAFELLNSAFSTPGKVNAILTAKGYFALAEIYLLKGQRGDALAYAQKSYALNSTNREVQEFVVRLGGDASLKQTDVKNSEIVFLGDQYFRAGDYFAAQAEYKAAFEADPKNGLAAMKAGQSLWELNQGREAIEYMEKAIGADPKLLAAYVLQADYYSQRYDYISAARTLNRARTQAPNSHEVLRGFALIELRRNNFATAIVFAKKALSIYDTDVETLLILAKSFLGQKPIRDSQEIKDAFKFAVKAAELDATNREAQIVYAKVLVRMQGFDIGADYMQKLVTNYPYVVDYRIAMAEINMEDERYSQATAYFQQIVDVDPNNKKSLLGLGKCLQEQGQMDAALRAYLRAATLDPTDAEALFHAGRLYLDTGKYQIAMTQFERVLKINRLIPKTRYFMGRAALLSGDVSRALEEAKNEKKVNPSLADAYILAAEAYALNRQYTQCATEYQQAVKLRSQGAEMYVKMARCYRLAGSIDVSLAMLQVAQEKESGFADIYKELGLIYEQQGEVREALKAFDHYLALSPNALDKKEIQAKIDKLEGL